MTGDDWMVLACFALAVFVLAHGICEWWRDRRNRIAIEAAQQERDARYWHRYVQGMSGHLTHDGPAEWSTVDELIRSSTKAKP